MNPKISVCIPVKNGDCWIALAIDSIINQKGFTDWEIVVFNDGSTDSTDEVLNYYSDLLGDKFSFYNGLESYGIGFARNYCNQIADGEIIVVQDADDVSHQERLKKTWKYFKRHKNVDIIYGTCQYIDALGKPFTEVKAEPFDFEKLKKHNYIQHPTVAYRRKAIIDVPYREECKVLDDWFLYYDMQKAKKKFGTIDDTLSFYRVTNSSVSHSVEKADQVAKMREKFAKLCES